MRAVRPRVMDASAMVGLFRGNPLLNELILAADKRPTIILLPTTAIADAESELRAGTSAWAPILMTPGLRSMELTQHAAVEIGPWPGPLSCRHAAHEAEASGAIVLTSDPGAYQGLRVRLTVV